MVAAEAQLGAVEQAVVVAVRVERVDQAVAVAVDAGLGLVAVDHAVVVAVGVIRVGARSVSSVAQAVAVAIGRVDEFPGVDSRRGVGVSERVVGPYLQRVRAEGQSRCGVGRRARRETAPVEIALEGCAGVVGTELEVPRDVARGVVRVETRIVSGAVVSMVHVWVAGVASALPAVSTARTSSCVRRRTTQPWCSSAGTC